MHTRERVIFAADELDRNHLLSFLGKIGERLAYTKIHNHYDENQEIVGEILDRNSNVWLDVKLHDIPSAVKKRAEAIARGGVSIISVHAKGGIEMMRAAVESASRFGTKILAVTELTSLDEEEIHLHSGQPSKASVLYLARLAALAGVYGIVCSPKEVEYLRKHPELEKLDLIATGIRSVRKESHDQKRFDTPAAAIKAGARFLVIGRQISQASDPVAALDEIERELTEVLSPASVPAL